MRFVNMDFGIDIEFHENISNVLVLESSKMYSAVLWELFRQYDGECDSFILSEGNKTLNLVKTSELLPDPFRLDFANKKIITRLYQELGIKMHEDMPEELGRINSLCVNMIDKAAGSLPYAITYDPVIDMNALLKMYGVKIDDYSENAAERLAAYIQLMQRLCGVKLFITVNLATFLEPVELELLYETVRYEKTSILMLENREREWIDGESVDIIDEDACLIHIR